MARFSPVRRVVRLADDLLDVFLVNTSPRNLLANRFTDYDRQLDTDWHLGVAQARMDQNRSKFNKIGSPKGSPKDEKTGPERSARKCAYPLGSGFVCLYFTTRP